MATTFQKCKTDQKSKEYPCPQTRCKHTWTVRYREPGGRAGRQREKSFPTKKQAEDHGLKMENDKREGTYLDPKRGAVPVKVYAEKWVARQHLAVGTEGVYDRAFRLHIFPALGHRLLSTLRPEDIETLAREMTAAGLTPNSVDAYMTPLRSVCKAAVNNGDIGRNPFTGAKLPKLPSKAVDDKRLPTGQQIQDIADEFRPELALSIWLMAGLGLRTGEVLGLRVGDFDEDRVRVRRQITRGKGGRGLLVGPLKHRREGDWRDVPLPTNIREAVAEHVATHGTGPDGALFQTRTGNHVATSDFATHFRKVVRLLDYTWSPHDLRHWFASTALSSGLPLLDVSRWLGHRNISETADTYGHLTPDSTGRAIRVMDVAITQHRAGLVLDVAA
ncbi:tyrosine-type recombinase/integrase [Streptomyces sp. NPDC051563]|uniref:tyrosine-type recombinase/integrase n=1 Tax=Streptomyces sp. NPDC051563 TaxID=3365659 RepID=UPI0037BC72B0